MTDADLKSELERLEKIYNFESQQLREKFRKQQQALRDKWAKENARFKIGDIIQANDNIIEVERIRGCFESFYKNPYVLYLGKVLTKALKPRKDESRTSIYDDGREIIKLK